MADDVSAKILNVEERPFHRAFLFNKHPCPHEKCKDNLSCYSEEGMGHHYRAIHKCPVTSGDLIRVELANIKDRENDEIRARKT